MAQELFTTEQIVERMLQIMQKKKEHVTRNGKTFIPKTVDDISPRLRKHTIKGKRNKNRSRAYASLYNEFVTRPKKAALNSSINKRHIQASKSNIVAMPEVGPTYPSIRATDSPMKGYKQVARTGRVEQMSAKKLVVNLSPTMTCTIQDNGLITVDFKS